MRETARVQKLITFSPQLYQVVLTKARQLGLSFGEYMRHLAVIDVKEEIERLPMVDDASDKRIGQSLKDLEEGRYTEVDPSDDKALNKALGIG
ncbi:hypothetical protein A2870_03860 [Candidatus Curtissbacteria bacterium RIFCSPHIGHO2_01_FULL_41_11]|uniref:Uncharacterized protein n=1 Tax=Candidatus Curtissbacteria bacterium RIFCSPHIGHO2_01_FULL_41_11 TaxID=1797711 RepID=A0A1F5G6E6_9BACT|nr:MAG: hypothetical protein A2870_03860 [Candidatus Curtissbacteria bacterium RIFCSPHIGHO2_01_FULL_41_11]